MNHPIFRTSFFALLDSYVPQLLSAEATASAHSFRPAAGQVGVFGILGQSEKFADTDYASIRTAIRRASADPQARSIDLFIDSPGGSVMGLPETADAIQAANRVKPVRAFVTGIAASAAYWLASQASTIHLTPSGEVGSVGVLDLHADISKALENGGVKVTAVHAGEHKVERAPFAPLSDEAKAHMQHGVNAWYGDFLTAVRRGRGARVNPSSDFGGGRMLSAKSALAAGMIDFIGGVL
ncbi:MAG TPA: S49 family peptidase [Candidatus Sulfotelmatobacter sp.]